MWRINRIIISIVIFVLLFYFLPISIIDKSRLLISFSSSILLIFSILYFIHPYKSVIHMILVLGGYDKNSIKPKAVEFILAGLMILPLTFAFAANARSRIDFDIKKNRVLDYVVVLDKEISKTRSSKKAFYRYLLTIHYDFNKVDFTKEIDVPENKFKLVDIGDTIMIEFSANNPNFVKYKDK